MISLSFGSWEREATEKYVRERVYWRGCWTPFVRVRLRIKHRDPNARCQVLYVGKGLTVSESMETAARLLENYGRRWPDKGEFEYNHKTGVAVLTDESAPPPPYNA